MSETSRFVPPPPPDWGVEWRGLVRWPFGSVRRRGHLLEQRVKNLEDRLAWIERELAGAKIERVGQL